MRKSIVEIVIQDDNPASDVLYFNMRENTFESIIRTTVADDVILELLNEHGNENEQVLQWKNMLPYSRTIMEGGELFWNG